MTMNFTHGWVVLITFIMFPLEERMFLFFKHNRHTELMVKTQISVPNQIAGCVTLHSYLTTFKTEHTTIYMYANKRHVLYLIRLGLLGARNLLD